MDIVEEKSVEKIPESEVQTQIKEEKPKRKPRTEAQKAAFEKARKTRAANLKKKKEEELAAEEYEVIDDSSDYDEPEPEPAPAPKPKKKGRGRPRGSTKAKKEEARPYPYPTPVGHRIPEGVNHGYLTQSAAHPFVPQPNFNPYGYWGGMPQQSMAPQPVNNYYYGSQQEQPKPQPEPQKEIKYTVEEPDDDEEYYYEEVQPQAPQLKFRFA